jgi:DNA gyrase subunit B
MQAALHDAEVAAEYDARTDKHHLRVSRRHHGNVKSSVITADFVHGADYEALASAGRTFKGLLSADAVVRRGEGERQKEHKAADFRAAMAWLMAQAEGAVSRQRYKGLGEMNPELWRPRWTPTCAGCCACRSTTPSRPTASSRCSWATRWSRGGTSSRRMR